MRWCYISSITILKPFQYHTSFSVTRILNSPQLLALLTLFLCRNILRPHHQLFFYLHCAWWSIFGEAEDTNISCKKLITLSTLSTPHFIVPTYMRQRLSFFFVCDTFIRIIIDQDLARFQQFHFIITITITEIFIFNFIIYYL